MLRELARGVMRVGGWRWVRGVFSGEIPSVSEAIPPEGLGKEGTNGQGGTSWELGKRWKDAREADSVGNHTNNLGSHIGPIHNGETEIEVGTRRLDGNEMQDEVGSDAPHQPARRSPGYDETGVDETLSRCWMVVYAVSAGWAQRDLLEDLENLFK